MSTRLIRSLTSHEDATCAEGVQRLVWPGSEKEIVPSHLILALARGGAVVLGCFEGSNMIGLALSFLGCDQASPERVVMARLKHCSHVLAVHPQYRDEGVDFELKRAQRQAVLAQGIRLVTWTYDPLEGRDANLNIRRLGGVCCRYIRDASGSPRDGSTGRPTSDRFEVEWWIASHRVTSRLEGERKPLELVHFLEAGAEILNPADLGENDLAYPCATPRPLEGNLALVEIPSDFQTLRAQDPGLAHRWRSHTRRIFESAFGMGYLVTDFVHLKEEKIPRSFYVLSSGEARFS